MLRRSKGSAFMLLILLLLIGGGGYLLFHDLGAPEITITPRQEYASPSLPFTVTATDEKSAVKFIRVVARQSEKEIPIIERSFDEPARVRQITFTLADSGLKSTTFDLEVTASDSSFAWFGRGNRHTEIYPMRIDLTPPRVTVKSSIPYVNRGGTGCVVYEISKDVRQTGVKVGNLFFPGFRQPTGDYLCFFAFPYYTEPKDYAPQLVAVDLAGNTQISPLSVNRRPQNFKKDVINLSARVLEEKAAEFERILPGDMPLLERFLKINKDVRAANAQTLMEIGKDTVAEMLWSGPFMRLPASAPRADFAEFRTYMWEGNKVDEQTHLGYDLASLKNADVPAANNGRVVFTGYLGIYGNLVVIDHGLGLQSVYSHLNEILAEKGKAVQKGEIIGRTGISGLAWGDHLHFGILVGGLEVTPKEWLDNHWIRDNIVDRINAVGGKLPAITTDDGSSPSQQNKPDSRRNRRAAPRRR